MTTRDLEAYRVGADLARQSRDLVGHARDDYIGRAIFEAMEERGVLAGDERDRWRAVAVRGYVETVREEG